MGHPDAVPEAPSRSRQAGVGPSVAGGLCYSGLGSGIRRRLWPIIGLLVALATLAGVYAYSLDPVYESSTTLLIERGDRSETEMRGRAAGSLLGTEVIVLRSDALAARVAARLDLWRHPRLDPRQTAPSRSPLDLNWRAWLPYEPSDLTDDQARRIVIERLTSDLAAEVMPDSQIIRLSFTSHDAELAAEVAAAYAETYAELAAEGGLRSASPEATEDASRGASQGSGPTDERLEGLRERVESSELALQTYREENGLAGIAGALNLAERELAELSERLVEARGRRERLRGEYEQLKGLADSDPTALAAHPVVARSAVIQTLTSEELRVERTVAELAERYGDQHPKMLAARSDLDRIRAKLDAEIADTVTGLRKQYEIADTRARLLEADLEGMNARVQAERRKELRVRSLERDLDAHRKRYEGYLKRLEERAGDADWTEVRVIDVARIPDHPVEPHRLRIILTAALLALLSGLALAVVGHRLDRTLRGSEDVEREIGRPNLGSLPLVERGGRRRGLHARAFLEHPQSDFAEAIRTVRDALLLAQAASPPRVVLVTSSVHGEGKTTLVTNLAWALAQMGRVLLLDADLRDPQVGSRLGLPEDAPGLGDLLTASATIDDCINVLDGRALDEGASGGGAADGHGLEVLPAGRTPATSIESLSSAPFAQVLTDLRGRYDWVLIDSPPVQAVSDAMVTARLCDGVVLVIEAGATPRGLVGIAIRRLQGSGAPLIGAVLNRLDRAALTRGSRYCRYVDAGFRQYSRELGVQRGE
jgi:capsular exopolysaccharide synthesis family protein